MENDLSLLVVTAGTSYHRSHTGETQSFFCPTWQPELQSPISTPQPFWSYWATGHNLPKNCAKPQKDPGLALTGQKVTTLLSQVPGQPISTRSIWWDLHKGVLGCFLALQPNPGSPMLVL